MLEELRIETQVVITSPHVFTTLLYNVSWWWSLYLTSCVATLASEALVAPGSSVPFLIEPTLVDIDGGRYVGPIFLVPLADLLPGQSMVGGGGNGGGGSGGGGRKRQHY